MFLYIHFIYLFIFIILLHKVFQRILFPQLIITIGENGRGTYCDKLVLLKVGQSKNLHPFNFFQNRKVKTKQF